MIQIYKRENTNFDMNGDAVLEPSVCEIDTSTWELNLEHPKDSTGKWKLIQGGAVLKVPSFLSDDQLFRICEPSKSDFGVTAIAYPIFFDSRDELMLDDVRPTNKNGQQALDIMCAGSKYNGESNIKDISTAYYNYKNLMEALTSEEDNSFINRWGGEVLYDNYKVIINEHIGSDNGVELLYGKNIPENGMNITENQRNIVTRIYPKAYNGYMISGNKPYVDSSIANCYTPSIRQRVIEFQDVKMKEDASENDEENGIIICANQTELDAALKKKCIELFEQGIDKPEITIECDMVMLQNSVDYAKYKDLEKVSQGDTVHCKNENLDIEITARVMSLIYDCILDNVKSVVIGSELYNYFKDTSSVINSVNKVVDTSNDTLMANRITGVINLLNTSLRAQKDVAQRQDVRAILFEDLDTKSPTFGALCIGTQGIQIAKKRTPDDSNWQWGTAIDFQSINADYVITGILTDKNGKFYLNLDTGELRMKDGTFIGIIDGAVIKGSSFLVERERVSDVRAGDPELIKNIIMGEHTPTAEEKERLDLNLDGQISALDYSIAKNILSGIMSANWHDKIEINTNGAYPQIEVSTTNKSGAKYFARMSVSSFISSYLKTINATINRIDAVSSIDFGTKGLSSISIIQDNNGVEHMSLKVGDSYLNIYSDRIVSNRTIKNGV